MANTSLQEKLRMTNNGKTCKNCGLKYWNWDICCQKPLFDTPEKKQKPKITTEQYNNLIKTIKKLQEICKKWRRKNRELKMRLKRFENLDKGMPDFLKGFGKNGGRYE